ncbi:hypothetical protein AOZ07_01500 [Glutamicibacter halophytocola]|nr:hypothetical protein AOZ07_01500 [Glutamicibacter halophytocola]
METDQIVSNELVERTDGWTLDAFADRSAAFVFRSEPLSIIVLDRISWYILELSDGHNFGEISESLGKFVSNAQRIASIRLRQLETSGLVTIGRK